MEFEIKYKKKVIYLKGKDGDHISGMIGKNGFYEIPLLKDSEKRINRGMWLLI